MESGVHAAVPLRVGKKMRKRRELDALVGGGGARGGRLLSASSDEGEPWARRSSRRRRTRPIVRLAAALALAVCVVSAATVLWLFVDVRRQIVSLRIEMDRVSTSSNSVDDALQVCHTAAKDLRANASALSERLNELREKHLELQAQVDQAVKNLAAVSGQLAAAPELKGMPVKLADLERTVAQLGSSIGSFDGALGTARKQAVNAATGVEEVKNMLHQLEARTNETIANVTANSRREEDIKQLISSVNTTLDQKVESLRTRIEDLTKTTSTAAPTSTTTITTSTTPAATTPSTTTTQPPGPPAKPNVLQ